MNETFHDVITFPFLFQQLFIARKGVQTSILSQCQHRVAFYNCTSHCSSKAILNLMQRSTRNLNHEVNTINVRKKCYKKMLQEKSLLVKCNTLQLSK